MPSIKERNPASKHALTLSEVRPLSEGSRLLVCSMEDYPTSKLPASLMLRRIQRITPVTFYGTMPPSKGEFYAADTGLWVVLNKEIAILGDTYEIKRSWGRSSWYAHEPFSLGLVSTSLSDGSTLRRWNEWRCVIRPEHERAFRRDYPRRVRPQ